MTCEYKMTENGVFIKDGHTMFLEDVLKDLHRKAHLEDLLLSIKEDNRIKQIVNEIIKLEMNK